MKKICLMLCLMLMIFRTDVQAAAETETAGASLGKEIEETEKSRAVYEEKWIQNSKGWWYQYKDGSYPTSTWRKIDGKWYYFNENGYWIDNKNADGTIFGIDVSYWQGNIDWNAVKKDGVKFAFLRVGRSSQVLDTKYKEYITAANKAGIPVGVYYYSKARTTEEAVKDAKFVIKNITGYKISYPVAIDLEDSSQADLSKKQLGAIAKAFCDEIRLAGYTPMLYANEYWCKSKIDMTQLTNVEKWIARYNYYYTKSLTRGVWQCTSTGRVNGIKGNVDINFGLKDYTKIVTPRTAPVETYGKVNTGKWLTNQTGKWYQRADGTYPANKWEKIDGKWYWFNAKGYMQTGWLKLGNTWYYLDPNTGAMYENQWLNNTYYLTSSGAMATGWYKIKGDYYYFSTSGNKVTNKWIDGNYYVKSNGKMAKNEWIGEYYVDSSGKWVPGKKK